MRVFRQSAIKEWKTCKRQAMLDYFADGTGYEKTREATDAPSAGGRELGTLVHTGVEAYYRNEDPFDAINADQAAEEEAGVLHKDRLKEFQLARLMLEGYLDWLAETGADIGERTVKVEVPLSVEVANICGETITVTGRLDRLVEDEVTGEFIIEDTKTVQSFEDLRWLAMGDQLLTYNILVRLGGVPGVGPISPSRGRHNQLRKVGRGPQAKPPFYSRVEVPFNDTQMSNHWTHLMATLREMVTAAQAIESDPELHHTYAYPNPTRDCTWRCDFLDICPMMDDGGYWRHTLGELYRPRSLQKENA